MPKARVEFAKESQNAGHALSKTPVMRANRGTPRTRFALSCPMTNLFSARTTCPGVGTLAGSSGRKVELLGLLPPKLGMAATGCWLM